MEMQRRNWKEYDEKLVRRGELYISLDLLENWDEELSKMNSGKVGESFEFPQTSIQFLACSFSSVQADRRLYKKTVRIHTKAKDYRLLHHLHL